MTKKESCVEYYEKAAEDYDKKRFSCECRRVVDGVFKDYVLSAVDKKKQILDAGCGTGRFAVFFAEKGKKVTAMDISDSMLEKTKEKAKIKKVDGNMFFIKGDIENIPLPDDSLEAISTIHVLVHYPDINKAVTEFKRVLKPGGIIVFEVANSFVSRWYNDARKFFLKQKFFSYADYYHSFKTVRSILEENGFSVCITKKVKKIPKVVMHFLLCVLHIKVLRDFIVWLEKFNFGTVSIIKGIKNK
jgi:ubiquinone/menaquinone biosynthesis C-methylase UbiE